MKNKNNTNVVILAVIATVAIMFGLAAVTIALTQSASAISDPDEKSANHSVHDSVRGISDPNERSARG